MRDGSREGSMKNEGRTDDVSSTGRILDISSTNFERSSGLARPLGSVLCGYDVRAAGKPEVLLLPTFGSRDMLSDILLSVDATLLASV